MFSAGHQQKVSWFHPHETTPGDQVILQPAEDRPGSDRSRLPHQARERTPVRAQWIPLFNTQEHKVPKTRHPQQPPQAVRRQCGTSVCPAKYILLFLFLD